MKPQVKKIFKDIENLRSKNNKNWMDLLRLSYEVDPTKTIIIIQNILLKDEKLMKLGNKLKKFSKK
tara:strand:+ start:1234 stop:1431 length:198 start_codon:yes stop_codon:yes gene_type:complete